MRKGQGQRPLLNARGLRALRGHWITHWHDSVIYITKWAQEYFQKPLSVNTIRCAICRCQLNLYHAKRKPNVNMVQKLCRLLWAKIHLKLTVSLRKSVPWSVESKLDILVQGSRVRPNFSRVRLTKIPGRTGASSHSRKEKKYPRLRNSVVQQKTPPLGLYRGLNQSEIVKGGPPSDWPWSRYSCMCVCALTNASRVLLQSERKRWVVEMRAVLPT